MTDSREALDGCTVRTTDSASMSNPRVAAAWFPAGQATGPAGRVASWSSVTGSHLLVESGVPPSGVTFVRGADEVDLVLAAAPLHAPRCRVPLGDNVAVRDNPAGR